MVRLDRFLRHGVVETNDIGQLTLKEWTIGVAIDWRRHVRSPRRMWRILPVVSVYTSAESVCTGDNVWRFDCIWIDRHNTKILVAFASSRRVVDRGTGRCIYSHGLVVHAYRGGERGMRSVGIQLLLVNRKMGLIEGMYYFCPAANIFNVLRRF